MYIPIESTKEGEKWVLKHLSGYFFLNLSHAIAEFIAGGIFGSSAVLADSVYDLEMLWPLEIQPFLETISNRRR